MRIPDDINELVHQVLIGNQAAFAEIYDQTINHIARIVQNLIYDKSQREDVIQEIYFEMYKSLPRYKTDLSFRPWLTGIAVRQIKAHLRKNWLFKLAINKNIERDPGKNPDDFSIQLIEQLDNKELFRCIDNLSFKLKSVVVLRYLGDHTQEEIAQILNLPIGTVRSRISYALKLLRKNMEDDSKNQMKKVEKYGF
jgi:RNA polymerase sigma-70 factor (ECF subfamily)